jgi:prepilin-type N-terminal cleavage/methylation domain-containing protein
MTTRIDRIEARRERGFSLIEVVIAIGVLAGVLLSVCSMFILGGRQLKTGKTMTEATTLCNDLMESFDNLSYSGLYTTLGAVDTDTSRTVTSSVVTSPINSWQAEISRKLESGVATVTLVPLGLASPLNFASGTGIRATVSISWSEVGRQQTVALSTVRF